mmetsp:Transcript_4033/g.8238  ORF Transcript_4033/g.8238 Transcript_4033/m.8238 type:complete len:168 (+) Transcript_4033:1-504(+)
MMVHDVALTKLVCQGVFHVQSTILTHEAGSTRVHFKSTSPRGLAQSIAEVVTENAIRKTNSSMGNEDILELLQNDQAVERARFLLSLLPTLCAHGALEIIKLAQAQSKVLATQETFSLLFKDHRFRQQVMFASNSNELRSSIHHQSMPQLANMLREPLASQPFGANP